jgi:uncharacterized protein
MNAAGPEDAAPTPDPGAPLDDARAQDAGTPVLDPDAPTVASALAASDQVPVGFVEVVVALPSTHPIVVLEELDAPRRQLRIPVGLPEGSAIAYAQRQVRTPRPLTHELFATVLERLDQTIEVLRITGLDASTYLAELVLSGPTGMRVLSCRPSDGIALVLRQRPIPPITAARSVLEKMGGTSE